MTCLYLPQHLLRERGEWRLPQVSEERYYEGGLYCKSFGLFSRQSEFALLGWLYDQRRKWMAGRSLQEGRREVGRLRVEWWMTPGGRQVHDALFAILRIYIDWMQIACSCTKSCFLFFQMVQAIQVLRFHLLELEKVSSHMNVFPIDLYVFPCYGRWKRARNSKAVWKNIKVAIRHGRASRREFVWLTGSCWGIEYWVRSA